MDTPLSLYIDHQNIAPLVRLLENTVETCRRDIDQDCNDYFIKISPIKSG